ncbi:MAG: presenilin family intramembrane aspartyl protease [Patescibacteria group bacterium]|nr:presenilin family intramembrane aspartyl protease [Patescibacteria group bacterium]
MPENNQNQKQEEIKTTLIHPWRVFGFEVVLFSLSMILGVLASLRLKELFEVRKISPPSISIWQFIVYFILATLALLLIIYFFKSKKRKGIFFKIIFFLAIGFGNLFFFGLWLSDILSIILAAFIIIALFKKPSLIVHNFTLIFAVAGVGAGLGLGFKPEMVILLLLIFSFYDYIAVYKTKHMVKMAEEMIKDKAIIGFVVPQRISDFKAQLKEIKPGGKFLILGAGDIVFPLILVISLIPQGVGKSLIVALFSLIGLFTGFLFFIFQKRRQPMPALPPIAISSIIGYLLTRIF